MREEHDRGQLPHQNTPLGGPHETKAHAISPPAGSGFRIRPSQLSFEKFVRSCGTPRHNDLGRLTGTFKPMRNFGFLPMPCADVLDLCKRDLSARRSENCAQLMRAVEIDCENSRDGCTPTGARVAVYLVWRLYREWRLYQLHQLWLDGYESAAQPNLWPVRWALPLGKLADRVKFWEARTSMAQALCLRTKNLTFTSRFVSELLERYARRFDAACDRVELGTSSLALQEPSHVQ
jgi:hypothetical protein